MNSQVKNFDKTSSRLTAIRILLALLLLVLMNACSTLGTQYPETHGPHGRVLNEINDKPIAQAIVVALWKGTASSEQPHKQICYHVETTMTDDKGYFEIPNWHEPGRYSDLTDKQVHIKAFHTNYRTSELTSEQATKRNFIYYLSQVQDVDDADQVRQARQQYLLDLVGSASCDLDGDSRLNLHPLYQAIMDEAKTNARNDKDHKIVQRLNAWLAYVKPHEE